MEAYKAKLSALAYSLQQEHERDLEMLRATIATGQSALKSALLINGGAAVAMFAFLGNAWSSPKTRPPIASLANGLTLFVWGVMSAACAAGATYLLQAVFGGGSASTASSLAASGWGLPSSASLAHMYSLLTAPSDRTVRSVANISSKRTRVPRAA